MDLRFVCLNPQPCKFNFLFGHNHKMMVGDGRGSRADRRTQFQPDLQISQRFSRLKLALSGSKFLFGPLRLLEESKLKEQISCGFQPTEEVF